MKTIYTDIIHHLRKECPWIQTLDLNTGQLEGGGSLRQPPVAYPAVLLDIRIDSASDLSPHRQYCEATISVTYRTDKVSRTASHYDESRQSEGLHPYEEVADLYRALQGFRTEHFDPLSRVRQAPVSSPPGTFGYITTFRTAFVDDTARA